MASFVLFVLVWCEHVIQAIQYHTVHYHTPLHSTLDPQTAISLPNLDAPTSRSPASAAYCIGFGSGEKVPSSYLAAF